MKTTRNTWIGSGLALLGLAGFGCLRPAGAKEESAPITKIQNTTPPNGDDAKKEGTSVNPELIAADNAFGLHLFQQLMKQMDGGNVFISPTSIALALQMAYNGADGDTQRAMAKALELNGLSLDDVNKANADLLTSLRPDDARIQLAIANSLWFRKDDPVRPEFAESSKTFYHAEIGDLAEGADRINGWVSDKTKGKIPTIIQSADVASAVAILLNAVYFKGLWETPFEKRMTREMPFTLPDGSKKTVQMMHQSGRLPYYKGDGFQIVQLPYGKGQTHMVIVLPDENVKLSDLIGKTTLANWNTWMDACHKTQGTVGLPRFKSEYSAQLNEPLAALGMGVAFQQGEANFHKMFRSGSVAISKVIHKTFVEVNEEGTEAAAATGIVMTRSAIAGRPFQMTMDHPFLCAIRDDKSGALLFLGAINEPK